MPSYNDAAWSNPDDGYPDDWIKPPPIDSGIDDWVGPGEWYMPPVAAMPGTAGQTFAPQADQSRPRAGTVPNSNLSAVWNDPGSSPGLGSPPPPKPDPFAAYFSMIPASRLGAQAWAPPVIADSFGKFPQPPPPELPLEVGSGGILGGIGKMLADQKAAATDPWAAARNSIVGGFADPPLAADGLPANFGQGGILGALRDLRSSAASTQAVRGFIGDPHPFLLPNAGNDHGPDPNSLVRLVAGSSADLPPEDRDLEKDPPEDELRRKIDIPNEVGLNSPGAVPGPPFPFFRSGPPPSSAAPGSPGSQAQPSPSPSPTPPRPPSPAVLGVPEASPNPSETAPQASWNLPNITKPYSRPPRATTPRQRFSAQGKPCSNCGAFHPRMRANHIEPLVEEYYRTGTIDTERMRSPEAVNPQCPTCSAQQGAYLAQFSKFMKNLFGF